MDQVEFDDVVLPTGNSDFFSVKDGESKDLILLTKASEFPNTFDPKKTRYVAGVYAINEKGEGKVMILDLKATILSAIKNFAKKKPNWAQLLITISRSGSGVNDTKYALTGMSRSEPLNNYEALGKEALELIDKVRKTIQNKKS